MNSVNSEPTPGPKFELPPTSETTEVLQQKDTEPRATEEASAGKRAPQFPPVTLQPTPVVLPPAQDPIQPLAAPPTLSDMTADDTDLIEKEWVSRAKAIVARTQDDPYIQKKEMSKVKADYIQKRFNKTIKTDETVSP